VNGRPIKVFFVGDELRRVDLYDRDQGAGEAERLVAEIRARVIVDLRARAGSPPPWHRKRRIRKKWATRYAAQSALRTLACELETLQPGGVR